MPVTIRPARPADAPVVIDFNCLLAEESEGKTLNRTLLTPGVAAALADPHKCLYFLAEEDGKAIGQMMVTYEWSDWRNGWIWWVQSVYVVPECRRRGVFRSLFAHVRQEAVRRPDVIGMRLYVEKENLIARQTYERLGMQGTGYLVLERYPL